MSEDMFATSQADNRLGLSDVTPWAKSQPRSRAQTTMAGNSTDSLARTAAEHVTDNIDHRLNERLQQQRQTINPDNGGNTVRAAETQPAPAVEIPSNVSNDVPHNEIHPVHAPGTSAAQAAVNAPLHVAPPPVQAPRPSFQLPPETATTPKGAVQSNVPNPVPETPAAQIPDPVPHPEYRTAPSQPAQPAAYTFRQPARPSVETMHVPVTTNLHPSQLQLQPQAHVPAMHTTQLQAADDDLFTVLEALDNRVLSMEQAISDLRRSQPAADGSMLRPVEKAVQRLSERLDRLDGGNQQQIGYDDEPVRARPQKRRRGNGLMSGLLDVFKR